MLVTIVLIHPDQEDYQAVSLELTFSESVNQSCVRIPIQNDNRVEDQEELTVTLNSTDIDVIPSMPSTVTIVDDDGEDKHFMVPKGCMCSIFCKVMYNLLTLFVQFFSMFYRNHYWFRE